jgi:hypothetical protein
MAGVEAFPMFQVAKAIRQQVLDIKRPKRCWDEYPVVKRSQLSSNHTVRIQVRGVVIAKNPLRPYCPVISAGFEFFQVEI